jgi:ketosteroid isomerase-like protein
MKTRLVFALAGWALGSALPSLAQWRDTADPVVASKLVSFYNSALTMKYQDAFNRRDSAALAALFTEDAVQVAPEGLFFGRKAIERRFADLFQRQRLSNFFGARDQLSAIGSELWAVGEWWSLLPTQNGPVQVGGYWSEIYVRDGEVWKIRLSTFNVTPPKAGSAETE